MDSTRKKSISIKGSADMLARLNLIILEFLPMIYEYNNKIRYTGFYLKPVHIAVRRLQDGTVVKYYYYGRYWYRVEKVGSRKIKWIYVGKKKPLPYLPDPPSHPLEDVVVKKYNGNIEIEFPDERLFREISRRLYPT